MPTVSIGCPTRSPLFESSEIFLIWLGIIVTSFSKTLLTLIVIVAVLGSKLALVISIIKVYLLIFS